MIYTAEIKKAGFDEESSTLEIKFDENILDELKRHKTKVVEVMVPDNRYVSRAQQKKAYATINDIADYTGDVPERLKEYFKFRTMALTGIDYFSLRDCSMSVAREYINVIMDFVLEYEIPISERGMNRTDDIDRYLYKCIETRTCSITGRKGADIHHVLGSRIGMGRDRTAVDHSRLKLIALSREWHTKVHAEGEHKIFDKFKIHGIIIDRETLKKIGLRVEEID